MLDDLTVDDLFSLHGHLANVSMAAHDLWKAYYDTCPMLALRYGRTADEARIDMSTVYEELRRRNQQLPVV